MLKQDNERLVGKMESFEKLKTVNKDLKLENSRLVVHEAKYEELTREI